MNKSSLRVASAIAALTAVFAFPASATVASFSAVLSNVGEPNPTSPATGSATVKLDDVALTLDVLVNFANLTANASAGHIHCCTAFPGTGSVGVFQGFTGFPSVTSGTYANVFTLSAATFANLATGIAAGKAYVNIHSPGQYAAGEIRGFLNPVAAIPEPETYALMLAGLAVVGAATRRRRSQAA